MVSEIVHPCATRLGVGIGALLRSGCVDMPGGVRQRRFVTGQYALVWVSQGVGAFHDGNGRRWHLTAGDAFQRFPGVVHDVVLEGHARWWYVAVPSTILEALRQIGLGTLASPVVPVGRDPHLPSRFAALTQRLRRCDDGDLPGCLAAMVALIVELHRRAAGAAPSDPHRQAVEAACARIRAAPAQRVHPQALAQAVGMGYHAFRKAFARTMGCGMAAWAVRQRLALAQDLLTDPNLPVAEVARRVGYSDPLQFSALFRRHYGLSPRRWRRGH